MRLPALALLAAVFSIAERPAEACSLHFGDSAQVRGTSGPTPLLVSHRSPAELRCKSSGRNFPLIEERPAELNRSRGTQNQPLFFFRPVSPLPEGDYALTEGAEFTVSANAADVPPPTGSTFDVHIEEFEEPLFGEGCGASSMSVNLPDATPAENEGLNYRMTFRREDGTLFRKLVAGQLSGGAKILSFNFPLHIDEGGSLLDESFCASIAGVSWSGAVGPELDLGCPEPSSGCSCTARRGSAPWIAALLMLALFYRRRR